LDHSFVIDADIVIDAMGRAEAEKELKDADSSGDKDHIIPQ